MVICNHCGARFKSDEVKVTEIKELAGAEVICFNCPNCGEATDDLQVGYEEESNDEKVVHPDPAEV